MAFVTDKYYAELGGVKIYVEEYSFSRKAATGETVLVDRSVSLHNGGGKSARITFSGKSESPCAHLLDDMLMTGETIDFAYGGMCFEGAVLVAYSCEGKSGESEHVSVELACTGQTTGKAVTA